MNVRTRRRPWCPLRAAPRAGTAAPGARRGATRRVRRKLLRPAVFPRVARTSRPVVHVGLRRGCRSPQGRRRPRRHVCGGARAGSPRRAPQPCRAPRRRGDHPGARRPLRPDAQHAAAASPPPTTDPLHALVLARRAAANCNIQEHHERRGCADGKVSCSRSAAALDKTLRSRLVSTSRPLASVLTRRSRPFCSRRRPLAVAFTNRARASSGALVRFTNPSRSKSVTSRVVVGTLTCSALARSLIRRGPANTMTDRAERRGALSPVASSSVRKRRSRWMAAEWRRSAISTF